MTKDECTIIEEIAKQFNIPLEEAEKRMANFMKGLPKEPLSEDVKQKIIEAKLFYKKGRKCEKR